MSCGCLISSLIEQNVIGRLPQGRVHRTGRCGVLIAKGFVGLFAAKTLKAVSVFPKFLAAGLAIVAGHCEPLEFLRRLAHNGVCWGSLRAIALSSAPLSIGVEGGAFFLSRHSESRESVYFPFRFVVNKNRLPVGGYPPHKSGSRLTDSAQRRVKHSKWLGIAADIYALLRESLHNLISGKSGSRLRHKNLPAQFRKRGCGSNPCLVCQRLKSSDCLFELSNALCDEIEFGLSLSKLLLRGQEARFVGIHVYVYHQGAS
jgi:hypothetical protein